MASELFLDTAYALALISPRDEFQERARSLSVQLEKSRTLVVTTRAVLVEIGNALSKRQFRSAAIQLLESLEADPTIDIVPLSEQLYAQAYELYRARPDKEWGLVDCISFVVMQERRINDALTSDEHFRQAGFRALLREDD
ncbi:MAG: PIN domain-containing protein [Chloroflexia bacterium]